MERHLLRIPAAAVLLMVLTAGCGTGGSGDPEAGPVMSDLAPTYDARPRTDRAEPHPERPRAEARGSRADRRAADRSGTDGRRPTEVREAAGSQAGKADTVARARRAPVVRPVPVRVTDPSGDLSRSVEGSPASADIVAVRLVRRGATVEVRTTFAGAVPERQTGGKGMNVASFYDVDGNGIVDYEVWTSLADNGWGTGHLDRRRDKATFGPATGISVSVDGPTLVTRFPADRIGGARTFRWSAASEWGSYDAMASSTSARDYAPDDGAVDYPG